jgi:hypothetical protein
LLINVTARAVVTADLTARVSTRSVGISLSTPPSAIMPLNLTLTDRLERTMPSDPFSTYLAALEQAHLLGNDTEHTHRPALKYLIEAIVPGVTATNEPRRVAVNLPMSFASI